MKLAGLLACLLSFGLAAHAQFESAGLKVDVQGIRYPTLAQSARIQGDVIYEVSGIRQRFVSGHPLLTRVADLNLATWSLPPIKDGKYVITYHFALDGQAPMRQETVLIGNKFDRFFLRIFGARTTRVEEFCDFIYRGQDKRPEPRYALQMDGDNFMIDVFVTAPNPWPNTQVSQVARR